MNGPAAAAAAAAGAAGAAAFQKRSRKPQLKEYSGPQGQDSGGPGHGGGPPKGDLNPYEGPGGQDSGGPPKLKEFTPPGSPPPPPPKWYEKYAPDFFG